MRNPSKIALIFFSRTAEIEARAKKWLGNSNFQANTAVAQLLISQSLQACAQSGFEIIHFDEKRQFGETFGERLSNAFTEVFEMGYSAAIAVGNDSPDLWQTDWKAVEEALDSGASVLGPTIRGGTYLIGLQANTFNANEFASLHWQGNQIFEELQQYCRANTLCVLSRLRDLNTLHDLQLQILHADSSFALRLRRILNSNSHSASSNTPFKIGHKIAASRTRPPPFN